MFYLLKKIKINWIRLEPLRSEWIPSRSGGTHKVLDFHINLKENMCTMGTSSISQTHFRYLFPTNHILTTPADQPIIVDWHRFLMDFHINLKENMCIVGNVTFHAFDQFQYF